MKEHKYNNTVICSLSNEHCERILNWWNSELGSCYGIVTKGKYIGLIDGWFNAYTLDQVQKASAKIIELPEPKPSPQIIDLTNVEGVEMMVSDDGENWYKEIVIAKYADSFIDCNFCVWKLAKPIEVKKITMKQIEKVFGCMVEIVKEVSND